MKTTNIGVVILNYLAYNETIQLAKQFLNLPNNYVRLKIIIVDNHSSNDSFEALTREFKDNNIISVIQTPRNLGFANGNNYGYKILQQMIDVDFVIFSNSDVVLKDKKLFEWIINNYKNYRFGVLGPSIYSLKTNIHQSPCDNWSEDLSYNRQLLRNMKYDRLKLRLHLILSKLQKNNNLEENKTGNLTDSLDYKKKTTDKTLHGSFLIMSPNYLTKYELPFDTGTFLYMEEAIIRVRCEKENIVMLYNPTYEINHLQAVSTNKTSASYLKKQLNRRNFEISSLKRYINILGEK